ncbi:MAG: Z1 domain-containing protein [Magnetococcales bacterium]|nr:Z1 domain-containing protein [Magnetococcales bacterium]MBF0420738.1 Z1 domain-containing protein [Magnetococcales bacterium]
MNGKATDIQQKVVKFVQELLLDEVDRSPITPAVIAEKMDMVLKMNPRWGEGLNKDCVTDELVRRFSLWIGQDMMLKNDTGHEDWLVASRKREWRYWIRHTEWLERSQSPKVVEGLDQSTDTVLGLLEDPLRAGIWDRRGLVVGHVQSGKTGHYTGLICKAADAGYKIVIVLAGLHNNLRSQTQMRLDEGFLGYETKPVQGDMQIIGVGKFSDPGINPNFATNRTDKGDFTASVARNLGISPEQRPWLFVVKKNKSVLDRLFKWIRNHVADHHDQESGRKIVTNLPLLMIDDESDHASVDTGEQIFNADGKPDPDHEPTAINRLVRSILHSFGKSAYVGYTATPFANIFIHERGETREEGPDLFPSAFIVNLAAPSNYTGPVMMFGQKSDDEYDGSINFIREIKDHCSDDVFGGWMPQKHKNGHIPLFNSEDVLPPSLCEAIDAFLLACAIRKLRGHGNEHVSMLVHVTRFNSVQRHVCRQVEKHVRHLRQKLTRRIGHAEVLEKLRALWELDFLPTSHQVGNNHQDLVPKEVHSWEDVASHLADVVADIHVKMINGTAKDALDYSEHKVAGIKVIAVGGDKLSRGLTLEGLCVSYFLRASRMYDTLMQMGRWFGYRPGYLDLCRLYTTSDLAEWFGHITDAAEELREEFAIMAATGATPREYGLKVQSHSVLMVTSRLKMRSAKDLKLSFSGQLFETVVLYRTKEKLDHNLLTAQRLIALLGRPEVNPERIRNKSQQKWEGSFLWNDVPASEIIDFLLHYKTHSGAHKVNSQLLAEFIQSMSVTGELTRWTVAVIGGGEGSSLSLRDDITINMMKRKMKATQDDRYSIGRLMSPRDEAIDLDETAWNAALQMTKEDPNRKKELDEPNAPNGPAIRKVRGFGAAGVAAHPERGLFFLYGLDPKLASAGFSENTPPIIAFAISFPGSNSGTKVEYKVNNVFWEQEYGPAE